MKKRAIILVLCLLMSLAGCGATPAETTAPTETPASFLVGYGRQDITPKNSVPLRGSGNTSNRMSKGFLDYLYTTCTALTDAQGQTVLLLTIDNSGSHDQVIRPIREEISNATGVPVEQIFVSASHTHSGPDLMNGKESSITEYRKLLKKQMVLAAEEAMADRLPATMEICAVETQNMTFVRRYAMEDGSYAGANFGDFKASPIKGHESEADNMLQLMRFQRQGGKTVLLANFQGHPTRVVADQKQHYNVSADFVGAFRLAVEQTLDCHVAYFTGASGNLRTLSMIKEENITADHAEHGKALARYAVEAVDYRMVSPGDIRLREQTYVGKVNHSEDHLITVATEVNEYWRQTNDKDGATAMAKERGMESPHHASAILAKAKLEKTMDVPTAVLAVGEVAFAIIPYEMFDTNGMEIKGASPFAMTFLLTCTNDSLNYVPSALGYENGGYEVHQGRLMPGSGEELVAVYISLLQMVHEG